MTKAQRCRWPEGLKNRITSSQYQILARENCFTKQKSTVLPRPVLLLLCCCVVTSSLSAIVECLIGVLQCASYGLYIGRVRRLSWLQTRRITFCQINRSFSWFQLNLFVCSLVLHNPNGLIELICVLRKPVCFSLFNLSFWEPFLSVLLAPLTNEPFRHSRFCVRVIQTVISIVIDKRVFTSWHFREIAHSVVCLIVDSALYCCWACCICLQNLTPRRD